MTISKSSLPEARRSPDMLKCSVFTHPSWWTSLSCSVSLFTSPQEPEVSLEKFRGERIPSWRDCKLGTRQWYAFLAISESILLKIGAVWKFVGCSSSHVYDGETIKGSLLFGLLPLQNQSWVVQSTKNYSVNKYKHRGNSLSSNSACENHNKNERMTFGDTRALRRSTEKSELLTKMSCSRLLFVGVRHLKWRMRLERKKNFRNFWEKSMRLVLRVTCTHLILTEQN